MFEDAPLGFAAAARHLCGLPQDIIAELSHDVLDVLAYKIGCIDTQMLCKRAHDCGIELSLSRAKGAANALKFVFQCVVRTQCSTEELVAALRGTGASTWSSQAIKVITFVWAERIADFDSKSLAKHMLSIEELVDMRWKLAVSVQSNELKTLSRVFVGVELHMIGSDGAKQITSLEMDLAQFQLFSQQIREMATMLSTVA